MIPVNEPLIGDREVEYVMECLKTGWISSAGRYIEAFEEKWAAYCGRKYGVAMSNGSTALQAAVQCLNMPPGFKVVMPTFTIVSCALAVIYNGGIPVLVDCDPRTWCMDVSHVREVIENDVKDGKNEIKAIMPVHMYGHPVDMDPVMALARKYQLHVIEDAAEVHGAQYCSGHNSGNAQWKKCGSFGDVSAFSFYANKLVTTGEGGMVLTDSEELAEKLRGIRNLCFLPEKRFLHKQLGHNFRMTNLQAAIGLAQIERIDEIVDQKRLMGIRYTNHLEKISGLQLPVEESWARQVYWMYGVVLSDTTEMDATEFAAKLRKEGVDTRPFFLGMHEQPAFHGMNLFVDEHYPNAERLAKKGLYLPSGLTLTDAQIDEVCEKVRRVLKKAD